MNSTCSPALKNARMQAEVTLAGSGAVLEIGTTGMATILATVPLANPIGTVTADTLNLTLPLTDNAADNSGAPAEARIRKADGTLIRQNLTVGLTGCHINLSTLSYTQGVTATTITSASIQHAA